jgi:hypothetical protein
MYDDFKKDLITMLNQNQVLQSLSISTCSDVRKVYPEMLKQFQEYSLPKLAHLGLNTCVEFFTRHELNIWDAKGGFKNLNTLDLCSVDKLTCFVDRAPSLDTIELCDSGPEEWKILEDYPCDTGSHKPFGPVRHFVYSGYFHTLVQQPPQTIRAWCLLDRLHDVKILDLARFRLASGSPSPALFAPTAIDIRRIRALYPNLEKISIDVALQGSYAEWPFEVLTELARFEKPIVLMLYLHRVSTKRARIMNNRMDYLRVDIYMRKERQRLGLPFPAPFEVKFKVVKPWAEMVPHFDTADYWVKAYKGLYGAYSLCGWTIYYHEPEPLDRRHVRDLEAKVAKQVTRKLLGWDRKGYEKELQKRETANEGFAETGTLYDLWVERLV